MKKLNTIIDLVFTNMYQNPVIFYAIQTLIGFGFFVFSEYRMPMFIAFLFYFTSFAFFFIVSNKMIDLNYEDNFENANNQKNHSILSMLLFGAIFLIVFLQNGFDFYSLKIAIIVCIPEFVYYSLYKRSQNELSNLNASMV